MFKKIALTIVLSTSLFAMHQVNIDLNSYDIDARADFDVGQFNYSVDPESLIVGIRYIYSSTSNNNLDTDAYLIDTHFLLKQKLGNSQEFTFGLGAKILHTLINDDDFYALPLGAEASYRLPLHTLIPIYISTLLYYSPQVISFGDGKNYLEMEARLKADIINRAGISLGYREIKTDFKSMDRTFNKTWFIGMSFRF